MATFNEPVATVLWEKDYKAIIKITGQYSSAQTAANNVVVTANTLRGANGSLICLVDVVNIEYAVALANGFISLEFQGSNANATIFTVGKRLAGELQAFNHNPLGSNALGDINLYTSALDANDSFTIILSCVKSSQSPAAWANVENQPPNTYN